MNIAIVTGASSGMGREFVLQLGKYVDVDVDIAGCAAKPETILLGLHKAAQILEEKRAAMSKGGNK